MIRFIAFAALAFAGAVSTLAATPATAQDSREARSINVDLSDLNLTHAKGLETAQRRIRNAAEDLCGGTPEAHELQERDRFEQCSAAAQKAPLASLNRYADLQPAGHEAAERRPSR